MMVRACLWLVQHGEIVLELHHYDTQTICVVVNATSVWNSTTRELYLPIALWHVVTIESASHLLMRSPDCS